MHSLLEVLWGLAALFIVLAIAGYGIVPFIVRITGSDREQIGRNADDPVWTGKFAVSIPVATQNLTFEQATAIAFAAIEQAGGRNIEMWESATIVGWYRRIYNFTADRQLAVVLTTKSNGSLQFLCCSRPRYVRELLDMGVSRQRATRLAAKVTDLVALRSTTGGGAPVQPNGVSDGVS